MNKHLVLLRYDSEVSDKKANVWINETDSTYEPFSCTIVYFNEHF